MNPFFSLCGGKRVNAEKQSFIFSAGNLLQKGVGKGENGFLRRLKRRRIEPPLEGEAAIHNFFQEETMPEIKIKISNKIALCRKRYLISSNDNYTVRFEFDEEWENHQAKTARFIFDSSYVDVAFVGESVAVPKVIACETLGIGVFSDGLSSTIADVGCVLSVKDYPAEEAGELTNDQYETLLALLNELDLRQIKTIERIEKTIKIVYTDNSVSTFPIYDGVSVESCSVEADGTLSLTLSNGEKLNAGNVKGADGKDGEKGEKGEKGETGATPRFSIGTVTTLGEGENASASIGGTAAEPLLNLSLPHGNGGDWKKLAELTLAESKSGNIDFKTDLNGKTFSVGEVAVRIDAPASSGVVNGYVAAVSENTPNWNNACTFGYLPKVADLTKQTSVATISVCGDTCAFLRFFRFGEYFWNSTGLSETVYPGKIKWPGGKIGWLRISSSSAFPAGTVISVSGR